MSRRMGLHVAVGCAFGLLALPSSGGELPIPGTVSCELSAPLAGTGQPTRNALQIEFDEKSSLALVDDSDTPADYSPNHVHIRLSYDGPVLIIGRVTGRILISDKDGKTLGIGRCTPLTVV